MIFKKTYDGFPALRTALSYQKGGFFLGDGFVPELEEKEKYESARDNGGGYICEISDFLHTSPNKKLIIKLC